MQTIMLTNEAVESFKLSREDLKVVNSEFVGRQCPNIQVRQENGTYVPMTCDGKDCLAAQIVLEAVENSLATA